MRLFSIGILLLAIFTTGCTAVDSKPTSKTSDKPNIIYLLSDDDDYEHFGFMGNDIVHTPALDQLAAEGTLFTTAHVTNSLCRPSLASMLSGLWPHKNGVYTNYIEKGGIGNDKIKLDPRNSLPNLLKDAGYATFVSSKYWEGDPKVMGFTHGSASTDWEDFNRFVREDQQDALSFIDEMAGKKPMFMWWAPMLPHLPHNPPKKYKDLIDPTKIKVPQHIKNSAEYRKKMHDFLAMGAWLDEGAREIIEKLQEHNQLENTLFLFVVDNGWTYGHPSKCSVFEKGFRTPLILKYPGKIPAGMKTDTLVSAIDIYPTLLDYAGVEIPSAAQGKSLRPYLEGKAGSVRDTLYGAIFAHKAFVRAKVGKRSAEKDVYALYARTKKWKYVIYTQDVNGKDRDQKRYIGLMNFLTDYPNRKAWDVNLYDLENDPYETKDLSSLPEHKEKLQAFKKRSS